MAKIETYLDSIEYTFTRRRYGATGTCRFFTWLLYRVKGTTTWHSYGDPWPKSRLNKAELNAALIAALTRIANESCDHGPQEFCPRELAQAALRNIEKPLTTEQLMDMATETVKQMSPDQKASLRRQINREVGS